MGNMSYCRYENTLRDLEDCVEALRNSNSEDLEELNPSEFNSMVRLVDLCGEIYHEFPHFLTCVPEDDDYE
jgi:hypothetical protein